MPGNFAAPHKITPHPFAVISKDKAVIHANRAFSRLVGQDPARSAYPLEEIGHEALRELISALHDELGEASGAVSAALPDHAGRPLRAHLCRTDADGDSSLFIQHDGYQHGGWSEIEYSEAILRGITEGSKDLIAAEDHDFCFLYFNEAYRDEFRNLWGKEIEIGSSMVDLMAEWPEEQAKARDIWQRALNGEEFTVRMEFGPDDLQRRYYDLRFSPVKDSSGKQVGAAHIFTDVTSQVLAERHRDLLIGELNHRVKNTLSIVQAIARQTLGTGAYDKNSRDAFEGRLQALSTAHDLLTRKSWEKTALEEIVTGTTKAADVEQSRFVIEGPPVVLSAEQTVPVAMALHELLTNSLKYGALSASKGEVSISWTVEKAEHEMLSLVWREENGPPVTPPEHRGFGTVMIEKALAHELDGKVELNFARDGLVCTITAPLKSISE